MLGCRSAVAMLWAVWLGAAAPARAQHGTTGWAVMPMDPNRSVLLETQTAAFDQPGRGRGVWQTLSPRLEYTLVPWLSLAARPTLAHIDYASGASAFGPSDTELVVKARVWHVSAAPHASVSLGLSGELPTGDADEGTGNGHVSLLPFATFTLMPSRTFMLHAMLGGRVALGEHEAAADGAHAGHAGHAAGQPAAHGSVIMPHAQHELMLHTGTCFTFAPVVLSPGFELIQVLEDGHDTQLDAQLELALIPQRALRLAAGFDFPLTADPRFDWRTRLMVAWMY